MSATQAQSPQASSTALPSRQPVTVGLWRKAYHTSPWPSRTGAKASSVRSGRDRSSQLCAMMRMMPKPTSKLPSMANTSNCLLPACSLPAWYRSLMRSACSGVSSPSRNSSGRASERRGSCIAWES